MYIYVSQKAVGPLNEGSGLQPKDLVLHDAKGRQGLQDLCRWQMTQKLAESTVMLTASIWISSTRPWTWIVCPAGC